MSKLTIDEQLEALGIIDTPDDGRTWWNDYVDDYDHPSIKELEEMNM